MSFLILSSIATTMIRAYVMESKQESLVEAGLWISDYFSADSYTEIKNILATPIAKELIDPIVLQFKNVHVLLTDVDGNILLTTVQTVETENGEAPMTWVDGNLGKLNLPEFSHEQSADGVEYLLYQGRAEVIGDMRYQICAREIISRDQHLGYAVTLISTSEEDVMVLAVRKTIINSSLWVMLAAVIAVYLITERVINPLKSMTKATKKFAKGDFSTRVTVCGHDEIAELGEAFNNMAESLDNFEKMRNSFLANVSHDLRTPMTTIAGFIDGITSGAIPPEKHEYYLGIISSEVHRLSRLVADLLDISRLESGEKKFNFISFDIAEMARIILISFEQKISEKRLDVVFETDEDSIFAIGDKDAIHQVLYNLMHNAIKFSKEEGKLAIRIFKTTTKKVIVSVYDEGQGIPKEELPFIFDRFYKTDKSRGLDKSGVGLGLYICKTIIDAHGEQIKADAPTEDSAEFRFSLKEGTAAPKERSRDI